jgi:hypothetical protein
MRHASVMTKNFMGDPPFRIPSVRTGVHGVTPDLINLRHVLSFYIFTVNKKQRDHPPIPPSALRLVAIVVRWAYGYRTTDTARNRVAPCRQSYGRRVHRGTIVEGEQYCRLCAAHRGSNGSWSVSREIYDTQIPGTIYRST